jgi:hypothetical protein
MQRDYSTLLGRVKTLLDNEDVGYLAAEESLAKAKIEARFNHDRNMIARSLLAETKNAADAINLVDQELNIWRDKFAAAEVDFDWKRDLDYVRQNILDRIQIESAMSPMARLLERSKPIIIFVVIMIPFMAAIFFARAQGWIQ